jgi:hypothetical protein
MPKRPSPFEGEGQEGEVRHPRPVMLNKVSIHAESPHPVSAMPKHPSPFEGEGQEGEVRHPQPVMLNGA